MHSYCYEIIQNSEDHIAQYLKVTPHYNLPGPTPDGYVSGNVVGLLLALHKLDVKPKLKD